MSDDSVDCPICLKPIDSKEDCCTTKCNHTFHTSCLLKASKTLQTCPMCRANLESGITLRPKYTLEHVIQTIKDAYRLDTMTSESSRSHRYFKTALANLFTRSDVQEIVESLKAYMEQLQEIEIAVKFDFSSNQNVVIVVAVAMYYDLLGYPFAPNMYLVHVLHGLLSKYEPNQLLYNLNNAPITDELPNFHPLG